MTRTDLLIEPAFEPLLRAAGLADFNALMTAAGESVSRHAQRETVRLTVPAAGTDPVRLFVKRVFRVPFAHVRADWLLLRAPRSQPRREWATMRLLASNGLPTPRRVAVGERRRWGRPREALLVTEAAGSGRAAADLLAPRAGGGREISPKEAHTLLRALGSLFGRLHARGFWWPDAHLRHVLAAPEPSALHGWRLWMIDVERMERSGGAVRPDVAEWTALLRRCLPFEPTRIEQRAFWLEYAAAAGALPTAANTAPPECLPADSRTMPVFLCETQPNRLEPHGDAWIDPDHFARLAALGLVSGQRLLAGGNGAVLDKPGLAAHRRRERIEEGSVAALAVRPTGDAPPYYLKRYVRPPIREQIRRALAGGTRDSSAWREWHFARRLAEAGVPTVRCVALAAEMRGPWERRSALLTAETPGVSLERWLPSAWPAMPRTRRTALVRQVAAVARVMHAARLYHRDFYLSHLFVDWDAQGRPRVSVIDLGRMIERPWRDRRWRMKDLAALHYSTPRAVGRIDRLRFLRAYAPHLATAARRAARHAAFRRWIAAIEARTARMARHDRRRGRA